MSSVQIASAQSYSFSGHETFPFRLGWLWKGVHATAKDSTIFSNVEAIAILGVGKNMVRSIRHWCLALKVIQEVPGTRGQYRPTPWGRQLFLDDGGWDAYLEMPGTLWWLHWTLSNNIRRATTWYYVFNRLSRNEFTRESLADSLLQFVGDTSSRLPSKTSLERDVECMVRTYWTSRRQMSEESVECPLTELNLIGGDSDRYRLLRGARASLPDMVFIAALAEYYRQSWDSSVTIPVDRLLFAEGSPGRVFLLDESSLLERLERLEGLTGGAMSYDSTAGLRQILVHNPGIGGEKFLVRYYRRVS